MEWVRGGGLMNATDPHVEVVREEKRESGKKVWRTVTVRLRGMGTGISEASKRVPISSFATQGGKQVSYHFRQRN